MREVFNALRPGGLLAVTEIIFDPHFQPRKRVAALAGLVGFDEVAVHGGPLAYTMILRKPATDDR